MQRVKIEAIRQDPWFQRNYVPVNLREDGQVNLDDIQAVFNDIEVCCCFLFCLYKQNLFLQIYVFVLAYISIHRLNGFLQIQCK